MDEINDKEFAWRLFAITRSADMVRVMLILIRKFVENLTLLDLSGVEIEEQVLTLVATLYDKNEEFLLMDITELDQRLDEAFRKTAHDCLMDKTGEWTYHDLLMNTMLEIVFNSEE
jgi:hypothetical protein